MRGHLGRLRIMVGRLRIMDPKLATNVDLGRCPACGNARRRRVWFGAQLELCVCGRCDLLYSDPQPRGVVEQLYLEDYDLAAYFGSLEARKSVLFERRLDALGSPVSGRASLCDVGCGDGLFLQLAAARGWEITGVELNPPAAAEVRSRGATIVEGHLEDIDELPGPFDVVTCWDVIEHTPAPQPFAERLRGLVSPGGRLVLTTLNRRALVARIFRKRWPMVVEDHFTYWDRASLTHLLEQAGLQVEEGHHFGLGRAFVSWVDRLRGGASHRAQDAVGAEPPDVAHAEASSSSWDTGRAVLIAERFVNMLLDRTGTGVGIAIVARALAAEH